MNNQLNKINLDENSLVTWNHISALIELLYYKVELAMPVGPQKAIINTKLRESEFWILEGLKENQLYKMSMQAKEVKE